MARMRREQEVELVCCNEECGVTWIVEGRFNAEGNFEVDDISCPECGETGDPTDSEVSLA